MRDNGIRNTIDILIDTDLACLDRDELRAGMARIRHVQGWAAAALLEYTRRDQQLAAQANSASPTAETSITLTAQMDQTQREAASTIAQANLCDTNEELKDSLAAGEITSRHLALIAKCRDSLNPVERSDFDLEIDRVHGWARDQHFQMFERSLRDLVSQIRFAHQPDDDGEAELERQRSQSRIKSWVAEDSGLHNFLLSMDPIRAAKFTSAMQAELASLRNQPQASRETFGSLQIEAVINAMSGGTAARRATELVVIVDHDTLSRGRHEHTVCETVDGAPLPVPVVQRLRDEAVFTLFSEDQHGNITQAVDERTATRAQRRALAAMYRTCSFPDCTVPFSQTRMHHIEYHSRGGATQLSNLIPVCERHHHHIHDLGWTVSLAPDDRCATFTSPTGDSTIETHPDRTTHVNPNRKRKWQPHRPPGRSPSAGPAPPSFVPGTNEPNELCGS